MSHGYSHIVVNKQTNKQTMCVQHIVDNVENDKLWY